VIQVSGPAVDVQFEEATMPSIYQALRVTSDGFTVPAPFRSSLKCSNTWVKAVSYGGDGSDRRHGARHEGDRPRAPSAFRWAKRPRQVINVIGSR